MRVTSLALVSLAMVACGDSNEREDASVYDLQPRTFDMSYGDASPGTYGTPCDVVQGFGCEDGLHCAIALPNTGEMTGHALCVPNNPIALPEGFPCTPGILFDGWLYADFCAPGLTCTSVPNGQPVCSKLCFRHRDCKGGKVCAAPVNSDVTQTSGGGFQLPLAACLAGDGCDPIAQDCDAIFGMGSGLACEYSPSDNTARVTLCLPPTGAGMAGDDCMSQEDCAPGFMCEGLGFCRRICYLTPPSPGVGECPPAEGVCMSFSGSGNFGRCL
jgi:hypothetical protein